MKTIKEIYDIVVESLLLEDARDMLYKKFGTSDEIKSDVDFFWNVARHRDNKESKDVNYWASKKSTKTYEDFKEYLQSFKDKTSNKSNITDPKKYYELMDKNEYFSYDNIPKTILDQLKYKEIYNDHEWKIVVPNDKFASIFFSKSHYPDGSAWCTGKNNESNNFDSYKKGGPQYIFIDKKNKTKYNIKSSNEMESNNKVDIDNINIKDYSVFPEKILDIILNIFLKENKENFINIFDYIKNEDLKRKMLNKYKDEYKKYKDIKELNEHLINAIRIGYLEKVKHLVEKGANINAKDDLAIRLAIEKEYLEIVKYLVENGANIHIKDNYVWAAYYGYLEIVKYLVENGAVFNDEDFIIVVANGHLEVVKYLAENGANIHANDDMALRYAAEKGHLEVVKFLVENDADVSKVKMLRVRNIEVKEYLEQKLEELKNK